MSGASHPKARSSTRTTLKATATLAADLRVLLGQLIRRLREQSHPGDFSASQKSVVIRLERDGPATISSLARADRVKPQSMGATVASLLAAGLVSGTPDPNDGRRTLLALTAAAHTLIANSRAAKEDWLIHALQARLNPAEQQHLAVSVNLLKRLLEP